MEKDNLPKFWAVLNDGSDLFKETVIKFINDHSDSQFEGSSLNCYYGYSRVTGYDDCVNASNFEKVLTIEEFIQLTKPTPPSSPTGTEPSILIVTAEEDQDIACPFCGEKGFDKPGLKYHINVYCVDYMNTEEL